MFHGTTFWNLLRQDVASKKSKYLTDIINYNKILVWRLVYFPSFPNWVLKMQHKSHNVFSKMLI